MDESEKNKGISLRSDLSSNDLDVKGEKRQKVLFGQWASVMPRLVDCYLDYTMSMIDKEICKSCSVASKLILR